MASITGANTSAAVQIATTWGTAVASGAGDKLSGEITASVNTQEIIARSIGSGAFMASDAIIGGQLPTVNIVMDAGPRNCMDVLIAQFMGTAGAPSEVTGAQGDYQHTITFNTTINAKYVTVAYESSSAKVHEFPTCAVRSVGLKTTAIPGKMDASFELVANKLELSTAVNTNAVLDAATATDTEIFGVAYDDDFWINTQTGGALSSSDQLNIISYDLKLTRPQEIVGEIKGSAGCSAPLASGLFEGTLTLTLRELADHTYYDIWAAETAQKCKFNLEGSVIAAGTNRSMQVYIPRMKLIKAPTYAPTGDGTNAVTYEFRILKASANPTGMSSTYPYITITNTLSTSLLA